MKNNLEKIKPFLKTKQVLIVTESSTDRTAWKKLFMELGVNVNNFHNASKLSEAHEILDTKRVDILFISYMVGGKDCFSLVDAHISKYPDRSEYFCYMVSEKNSLAVASTAAEREIDGLLIKPYNQMDLQELVTTSLLDSVDMNKETRAYYQILAEIRDDKIEEAEAKAEEYILKKPHSPNGYYLRGLTKKTKGQLEEALGTWKIGLTKDDKHHKLLCSIFDAHAELRQYKQSYTVAEQLTAEYPINPVRIPNFIRASLATKNYHNLIKFCEMMIDVDDDLSLVRKPIAAALAICGKNLLLSSEQENRDLIIQASRKAISLSEKQSKIYLASLENLLFLEKYEAINEYINEIPSDELSLETLSLELQVSAAIEKPESVFTMAQNLIKIDKVSPQIYIILLKSAKKIGKSAQQLEDIFFEASKKYPELKDDFHKLIV